MPPRSRSSMRGAASRKPQARDRHRPGAAWRVRTSRRDPVRRPLREVARHRRCDPSAPAENADSVQPTVLDLRRSGEVALTSRQMQDIVKSSMVMDKAQHTALLEQLLPALRAPAAKDGRVRRQAHQRLLGEPVPRHGRRQESDLVQRHLHPAVLPFPANCAPTRAPTSARRCSTDVHDLDSAALGWPPRRGYLRGSEWNQRSRYVADQLIDMTKFMEEHTGRKLNRVLAIMSPALLNVGSRISLSGR